MIKAAIIRKPGGIRARITLLNRGFTSSAIRLDAEAEKNEDGERKAVYFVPRSERSKRAVFNLEDNIGEQRLHRFDRACPTRELNFTPDTWQKHKSPYRKIRHVLNTLRSSPFQRLLYPDLAMVSAVSVGLSCYNEFVATPETQLTMGMGSFAGITTAIGMLAGFRLNASYGRYEECRIFWGETNNTIRDMAQETMMYFRDPDQRSRMLKILKAYPVVLNFHLNAKGGHHDIRRQDADFDEQVHAEFMAELADIYSDGSHMEDYERMCKVKKAGGNTPIEVLTQMRETIAGGLYAGVDPILVRAMDYQCERLCGVFGASERVLRTALPTGFTRHTSRLMFLWTNLLPFALYPAMGPIWTLPYAVVGAYAMLGIEDIGVQLEEPFDILPLRQYSDGMFDAIGQVERNYADYKPASMISDGSQWATQKPGA